MKNIIYAAVAAAAVFDIRAIRKGTGGKKDIIMYCVLTALGIAAIIPALYMPDTWGLTGAVYSFLED